MCVYKKSNTRNEAETEGLCCGRRGHDNHELGHARDGGRSVYGEHESRRDIVLGRRA